MGNFGKILIKGVATGTNLEASTAIIATSGHPKQ